MDCLDVSEVSLEDTFRILVATDIHLGYAENDQQRSNDCFIAFEEILQLAKLQEVDFILLGGDLFHENKPSTVCLQKCLSLLRKYCMGDKPISVQFLSDQNVNFKHCSQSIVNYLDPNLNVSIPIFSIHGNHDDPSGHEQLSALDVLSTCGLVNYFGKWTNLQEIKISPILLQKGKSKLALYGLSHIKDERLFRLFRDHNVHFYRPNEDTEEWFNIFICHQNRVDRGNAKYLPEENLPNFLDLVVWGHEHECRLKEEWNATQEFFVTQPGSSVATSLCEGEAKQKFVGLLNIYRKKFKLQSLPLKTVRPFIFQTLVLSECDISNFMGNTSTRVQEYLRMRIDCWIREADLQLTGHEKQPQIPLIRIRVEYKEEEQTFNAIRFGQPYQSQVANPTDMILLKKEKVKQKRTRNDDQENKELMEEFLQNQEEDIWEEQMPKLMKKYFTDISTKKLHVLTVNGISKATTRFIEKSDKESFSMIINHQTKEVQDYLYNKKADVDHLHEEIENFRMERQQNSASENDTLTKIVNNVLIPPKEDMIIDSGEETTNEDVNIDQVTSSNTRGRSRGRGRSSRARNTTTRGRGKVRSFDSDEETTTEDVSIDEVTNSDIRNESNSRGTRGRCTTRGRGRARGSKTNTTNSNATLSSIEQFLRTSARTSAETRSARRFKYNDSDDDD